MKLKHQMKFIAAALLLATAQLGNAAQPAPATQKTVVQKVFASPEEAARALAETMHKHDMKSLLAIISSSSHNWLWSGDEVADRLDMENFLASYDRKSSISQQADGKTDWNSPFHLCALPSAG